MNHWRNVEVYQRNGRWRARGEYVCVSEGGTIYRFDTGFTGVSRGDPVEEKRRAEYFISAIA